MRDIWGLVLGSGWVSGEENDTASTTTGVGWYTQTRRERARVLTERDRRANDDAKVEKKRLVGRQLQTRVLGNKRGRED